MSQHIWSKYTVSKTCVMWSSPQIITSSMSPKWPHHLISMCHSMVFRAINTSATFTTTLHPNKETRDKTSSVKTRKNSLEVFRLKGTTPSSVAVMTSWNSKWTFFKSDQMLLLHFRGHCLQILWFTLGLGDMAKKWIRRFHLSRLTVFTI